MYPKKLFDSFLDKHAKIFVPVTAEGDYQF